MYIGLVIHGALETVTGGYLYDRRLVEHFEAQGSEVEVLSMRRRRYLRNLTDNFSLLLGEWLRAVEFDVLLQDELNHPSLFRLNERLRGKIEYPIVSIVHHLRSSEAHRPGSCAFTALSSGATCARWTPLFLTATRPVRRSSGWRASASRPS